ncbi:hypothetical protein [Alteribacillus bidgolensis]|nr:hypothetical protein [Alteribacillus bidgolensis]
MTGVQMVSIRTNTFHLERNDIYCYFTDINHRISLPSSSNTKKVHHSIQ